MNVFNPIEYALSGCLCSNTVNCCYSPEDDAAVETVIVPHEHDILFGRGGKNNKHVGNERLRRMARASVPTYRTASKKSKSHISRTIVSDVHSLVPPGRFLKRDHDTGLWVEVGDDVAREKTSQALRDAVSAWNAAQGDDHAEDHPDAVHSMMSHADEMLPTRRDDDDDVAEETRDEFLPPPPTGLMSSPPPPPKHLPHIAVVSPTRLSPQTSTSSRTPRSSLFVATPEIVESFRVSPPRSRLFDSGVTTARISPLPVLSSDFLCEMQNCEITAGVSDANMNDFDLFDGSLLRKTDSASDGSLSFTKPREKKMRID